MKEMYIKEIEAIKANIEELKEERAELWKLGRRDLYNMRSRDIRDLNERIRAIEEAYGEAE